MSSILDRVRDAVRERRRRSASWHPSASRKPILERVPTSILVNILRECDLDDIYAVSLSCRGLHQRINQNQYWISQEYLRRRQRCRGITSQDEIETISPGDDLTFISYLFPPPPPQYADDNTQDDRPEYSLGYLTDLTRCWTTCVRLSYYLASFVVQHHLKTDPVAKSLWSSSKTEKDVIYSKGVSLLQSRVLYPIAYIVFFLETYAASNPPTPAGEASRSPRSLRIQQSILQGPPFTNTQVLLSTHHCMHLLCASVRRLMTPVIPYSSTENWMSLLLTTSTLERIVEFFATVAEDENDKQTSTPRPTWTRRMEFMRHMRIDLDEYLSSRAETCGSRAPVNPGLRDVWFQAAEEEIARRGALPHDGEEPVPILHGSAVMLRCSYCDDGL